jgi:hypothetical protein
MTNIVKENRIGKFLISSDIITNRPDVVQGVLGRCIVVRAEQLFYSGDVEYFAYSELFRPIERGDVVPRYKFELESTMRDDGHYSMAIKSVHEVSSDGEYGLGVSS